MVAHPARRLSSVLPAQIASVVEIESAHASGIAPSGFGLGTAVCKAVTYFNFCLQRGVATVSGDATALPILEAWTELNCASTSNAWMQRCPHCGPQVPIVATSGELLQSWPPPSRARQRRARTPNSLAVGPRKFCPGTGSPALTNQAKSANGQGAAC